MRKLTKRLLSLIASGCAGILICACATIRGPPVVAVATETEPFRLSSAAWSEPYSGPLGVPKAARRAVLGVDPRTKGETYYAHFPAGTRFELHWHAYAEYAVVLRGAVTHILGTEQAALNPGDYVVIPPGVSHGWVVTGSEDAYILIRRAGPADQHFVQP